MVANRQPALDEWRRALKPGDRVALKVGISLYPVTLCRKDERYVWQSSDYDFWEAWDDPYGEDREPRLTAVMSSYLVPLPAAKARPPFPTYRERRQIRRRRARRRAAAAG